jgi:hypothetical protein
MSTLSWKDKNEQKKQMSKNSDDVKTKITM